MEKKIREWFCAIGSLAAVRAEKRKRKSNVEHHCQSNDLRLRLDVAEGAVFCHPAKLGLCLARLKSVSSDNAPQQDRTHVWQAQRLATRRNPIRPMSQSISVSNRPRCNRHILGMSPEPSEVLEILNATIPQNVPYLYDSLRPLLEAI